MQSPRNDIQVYKQRAREAEEKAALAKDEKLQKSWLEIAKGYRLLIEQQRAYH
jgi:hypothetical protein